MAAIKSSRIRGKISIIPCGKFLSVLTLVNRDFDDKSGYLSKGGYLLDFVDHPHGGERGCVLEIINA